MDRCCEEGHSHKKVFLGVLVFLFGLVWYLKDTGRLVIEPFWPIVAMVLGIIWILKGIWFKTMHPKKK